MARSLHAAVSGSAGKEEKLFPEGFLQSSLAPQCNGILAIPKRKWELTGLLICLSKIHLLKEKDNFTLHNFMGIRDSNFGAVPAVS